MDKTAQNPTKYKINRLLAWFFASFFVLSTIGILFSFFPTRKLLSPDLYKQSIEDVRVYQKLPETLAEQLATNFTQTDSGSNSKTNSPIFLLLLDQSEWESILIKLINPDWMQSQTESVIDQIFEILLNSPDPVNTPITVSLVDVKSRLGGQEGIQAFNQILEAQIPCSVDQLMGLLQLGLGMETSINSLLCRPPDYIRSELNPFVESFLTAAAAQMPDQLTFYLPLLSLENSTSSSSSEFNPGKIPEPIAKLRRFKSLISWSPLLPLVFIILVTGFAVRSLMDFLRWWGGMFLAAGLISLLLSLVLFPIADWGFNTFIPNEIKNDFGLTTILFKIGLEDLFRQLANELIMSALIPAGILTIIGFTMLLGSYLLAKRNSATNTQVNTTVRPFDRTIDS